MTDWKKTIATLAPTVATALVGPLAGEAVAGLMGIFGVTSQDEVRKVLESGQLTGEQISKLREMELQFQENERERGFKYEELAFKDRDSARRANVDGQMQKHVFWLGVALMAVGIGTEIAVLINGLPKDANELVIGRVLGLLDSVVIGVFTYIYGSSKGSADKNSLMAQK